MPRVSLLPERRFDEEKTTQAAAYFLQLAGGRMNYMLLIKLLYLLDRKALLKWGRPVTGDDYFSMKLGPVLSEVLNLVNEMPNPNNPGYWVRHISAPQSYEVELLKDPGDQQLSEAEESTIEAIFHKYGHFDPLRLAKLLHGILPEWQELQSGRCRITYTDILQAGKKSPTEVAAIESELYSLARIQQMFAPH
jgi:uncharacterized phage-associated protein